MSERIFQCIEKLRRRNETALVAYVTGGDPDLDRSFEVASAVVEGGADMIELGIPFSDPLADGETNQLAASRAISSGVTPVHVLDLAGRLRGRFPELPIVIFSYLNPMAYEKSLSFDDFCSKAAFEGVDAVLCLDITPEEALDKDCGYSERLSEHGLGVVGLVVPTTSESRMDLIAKFANAFIYYVSREGVTGESDDFKADAAERIRMIKSHTKLPVVIGFGISTPEHVRKAASSGFDGVVVGSAIVRRIGEYASGKETLEGIKNFVFQLKKGAVNA